MATANRLVMCPYDEVHKVKESRLQIHITKCRLNHQTDVTFNCPFNSTHIYPVQEKNYHLLQCPDRKGLDRRLVASLDDNNPYRGRTAVPSYTASPPVVSEESWNVGPTPEAGYNPPSVLSGAMYVAPAHSKPAERRKMYQLLFQDTDAVEDKPAEKVRVPAEVKKPSEPSVLKSQVQNAKHTGLGRGQGTSRIAANIYPPQNGNAASESRYSGAISTSMGQLAIGRGQPWNSNGAQANVNMNDYDEFPALGCGRGMPRTQKSNSYAGAMNARK